jgi:ribosomal protein S18 acetylase RimI-like enzyme
MRTLVRRRFPAPIILPAERTDIPALVRITVEAQRSSVLNFYAYPTEEDKAKVAAELAKLLDENWDAPHVLIAKAVDPETKEITAMAIWQLKGYSKEELGGKATEFSGSMSHLDRPSWDMRLRDSRNTLLAAGMLLVNEFDSQYKEKSGSSLEQYVDTHFRAFLDSWTKGTKHIYLSWLATDPRFQRRGIGTAMLDWGHQRADKDGVPAFLIASPFGHGLYAKLGWKDVETPLQLELKDWVKDAQNGDMGWGTFKFYYMLRMPKSSA